jgi:hypothetical protein
MATTFLKRQKEMKRMEKQREKAERRAQKKLANRTKQNELPAEGVSPAEDEVLTASVAVPPDLNPQG